MIRAYSYSLLFVILLLIFLSPPFTNIQFYTSKRSFGYFFFFIFFFLGGGTDFVSLCGETRITLHEKQEFTRLELHLCTSVSKKIMIRVCVQYNKPTSKIWTEGDKRNFMKPHYSLPKTKRGGYQHAHTHASYSTIVFNVNVPPSSHIGISFRLNSLMK